MISQNLERYFPQAFLCAVLYKLESLRPSARRARIRSSSHFDSSGSSDSKYVALHGPDSNSK